MFVIKFDYNFQVRTGLLHGQNLTREGTALDCYWLPEAIP